MPADKKFIEQVIVIVKNNFGDYTAKLYTSSFSNKTEEEILDFMNKLLTEFVGPENAAKQLKIICEKKI